MQDKTQGCCSTQREEGNIQTMYKYCTPGVAVMAIPMSVHFTHCAVLCRI